MKKKNGIILNIAYLFEKILAVVVLIAVFLGTIDVCRLIWDTYIVNFENIVQYDQLNAMLGQILLLVIGVELVVMLSLHIPGALIEALLYAIARKMLLIPKNEGMFEILLGVISIAGLFMIKKYISPPPEKAGGKVFSTSIHSDDETEELERLNDHQVDFFCRISPTVCRIKNKITKSERCATCDFYKSKTAQHYNNILNDYTKKDNSETDKNPDK